MSDRAPYSRVYWSIVDDPKFVSVYDSNDHLATWLRLLMIADQSHPASAHLPSSARKASVKVLADVGLIDVTGSRFRIHGLDAERARRRDWATTRKPPERDPNGGQAVPERDPNGFGVRGLRLDETRLDKLSRADARDEPHIEAWLMTRHRPPTPRQQAFLDRYLQVFDETGTHRMAQLILENPDDPIAALKGDLDRHREERLADLGNGSPRPRPKPQREPWQELLREKLAADEDALQARSRLPGDAA